MLRTLPHLRSTLYWPHDCSAELGSLHGSHSRARAAPASGCAQHTQHSTAQHSMRTAGVLEVEAALVGGARLLAPEPAAHAVGNLLVPQRPHVQRLGERAGQALCRALRAPAPTEHGCVCQAQHALPTKRGTPGLGPRAPHKPPGPPLLPRGVAHLCKVGGDAVHLGRAVAGGARHSACSSGRGGSPVLLATSIEHPPPLHPPHQHPPPQPLPPAAQLAVRTRGGHGVKRQREHVGHRRLEVLLQGGAGR